MLYLPCLESLAPRPNPPLPLVYLVTPELVKLLITSISLHPTLKDSLLLYLDRPCHSHNTLLYELGHANVVVVVHVLCKAGIIPVFDVGDVRHGGLS